MHPVFKHQLHSELEIGGKRKVRTVRQPFYLAAGVLRYDLTFG